MQMINLSKLHLLLIELGSNNSTPEIGSLNTEYKASAILTGKAYDVVADYDKSGGGLITTITITIK